VQARKHRLEGMAASNVRIETQHSLFVLESLVIQVRVVGRGGQGQVGGG
jgi:hypothetical protein